MSHSAPLQTSIREVAEGLIEEIEQRIKKRILENL
jgi:hypothetical protein